MRSAGELIEDLMKKTGLPQEKILELIREKKQRVGGGFLSDAGAAYLVAADLGVRLAPAPTSELTLNQISVGLNEVTTKGRVLSIGALQTYKKRDKSVGVYRKLVIFDETSSSVVTLWDDKARLIDELGIKRGDVVRIARAYVRPDLDMKPVLHIGTRGVIELVRGGEEQGNMPAIDEVAQDLNEAIRQSKALAVKGRVASMPIETNYTRRDGQSSTLVTFRATGMMGGPARRIVIWDKDRNSPSLGQLKINEPFILTNVRIKVLPHGEYEFHSSNTSELIVPEDRGRPEGTRRLLRVLSVGARTETGSVDILAVGRNREFLSIRIKDDKGLTKPLEAGTVIALEGGWTDSRQVVLEDAKSLTVIETYEPGLDELPPLESFFMKISSITLDKAPVFLEAMSLSKGSVQYLDTKQNERVLKGELIVGDDTGEIVLTAWRDQATMFEGIVPGERIWVLAFTPRKGYTGLVLEAKSYSSIVQLRFRTQSS